MDDKNKDPGHLPGRLANTPIASINQLGKQVGQAKQRERKNIIKALQALIDREKPKDGSTKTTGYTEGYIMGLKAGIKAIEERDPDAEPAKDEVCAVCGGTGELGVGVMVDDCPECGDD